jgi:hypothetical protein
MTDRIAYMERRIRRLPAMLDGARRKVAAYEAEARRYGMTELLDQERRA